jgi:anaerobic sulfite reductase subunit C
METAIFGIREEGKDHMMTWSSEAEEALSRVPFFVRKRVRKRVEEEARRCGATEVSLSHVRTCQERFLDRMEEEVKGYRVEACFGKSGCPNRAVNDDALQEKLERVLSERDLKAFLKARVVGPLKLHHEFRVSVSDCPNACSRPQIVDVGLIGASVPEISDRPCSGCGACVEICREGAVSVENGAPVLDQEKCLFCGQCAKACPTGSLQEGKVGYRILIGGKLGRHPSLARELPGVFDGEEAMLTVDRCLDLYQENCTRGERFGEILERTGESFMQREQRE